MIAFRHNPPARSLPSRQAHLPSQASQRRVAIKSPPIGSWATSDLLRSINRYLDASGVKPSRFGRDAVGDPRLVFDLRNGRSVRHDVCVRVLMHINRCTIEQAKTANAVAAMAKLHREDR